MTRVVYVGGFGNGEALANKVGRALERDFEEVDVFTFSQALNSPNRVATAVNGAEVITHSAGFLAMKDTRPAIIHAFNAPLPTSRTELLARTLLKTAHMHQPGRGIHELADIGNVATFDLSSIEEIARHPIGNMKPFLNQRISKFDAIDSAVAAMKAGVAVRLVTTERDDYFHFGQKDLLRARANHVSITALPGEHDELPLRPVLTIDNYFDQSFGATLT